jgi:hypothetical protein
MDKLKEMILMDPCYEQHIVSIRDIYEEYLFSILIPALYEGFQSMYKEADKIETKYIKASKRNPDIENPGILIIFQTLIRDIPNLNSHKIRAETDRIKSSTKAADIFDDLIKAVCKSNIILTTYNIDHKRKTLLQTKYHENIIIHDFIHSCYIQSAKQFHIQPELFYHKFEPIIINQNKRACYAIIKDAIKSAIKLMLPMKEILLDYITHKYEQKDRIVYNPHTQQNVGTALPLQGMPGIIPGSMPGAMPGVIPGVMPGVMPGSMPGAIPGVMPGAIPGGTLLEDDYVDVTQMIDRDLTHNNDNGSLLEDIYDPSNPNPVDLVINSENANSFGQNETGFGQDTENAIKNKNYRLLLSDNLSPNKSQNKSQNNDTNENNESMHSLGNNAEAIGGSTDHTGTDKNPNENDNGGSNGGSDKSNASATAYGIRHVDISGAISKKTKPFFEETLPEIKKRVAEFKQSKKAEKTKTGGSNGNENKNENKNENEKENIEIVRSSSNTNHKTTTKTNTSMTENSKDMPKKKTQDLVDNILKT